LPRSNHDIRTWYAQSGRPWPSPAGSSRYSGVAPLVSAALVTGVDVDRQFGTEEAIRSTVARTATDWRDDSAVSMRMSA
jgi:hypothetical protein